MKETEQTLLDQIKDQVASENFNKHRWDLLYPYEERELWPVVCERCATAKAQASCEATLKKASEKAVFNLVNGANPNGLKAKVYTSSSVSVSIDKSSITDPKNITIV